MTTIAASPASPADLPVATATGNPPGLYVLFGAEMWERFSYYGMRALLVLYLTKSLGYIRKDALALYATYTGLVYLTPLLGGYLADKVLGQRKAIMIGGLIMAMGHLAMAFENQLYLALSLLILGNGFFKPNISTMVGNLFTPDDARRDGAYTVFYFGINVGATLGTLVCGYLGESPRFGWHYGFSAAAVGMVLGLIAFVSLQRYLVGGFPPNPAGSTERRQLGAIDYLQVIGLALLGLLICYGVALAWPTWQPYVDYVIPAIAFLYLGSIAFVLAQVARHSGETPAPAPVDFTVKPAFDPAVDWQRLAVILIVSLFSVVFWMGFEQAGGVLNLFADTKTDRTLYGSLQAPFAPSLLQSVNPILILILAPILSVLWLKLDQTRFKLTSSAKMGLGLIFLGIGFVIMWWADAISTPERKVGPQWLVGFYFFATLGEVMLSPIGLSLVNRLAPAKIASLMMAVWFLCTAVANYMAGVLESKLEAFHVNLFLFLIIISIVSGLILLVLTKPLQRMSHGRL